jgi:hypothetical protein
MKIKHQDSSVDVIQYPENIIAHGYNKTKEGIWIVRPNAKVFPSTISDRELGEAIINLINDDVEIIPNPFLDKALSKKLQFDWIRSMEKSSLKEVMQDARLVCVKSKAQSLMLYPTINAGHKGAGRGFECIEPDTVTITNINEENVGKMIKTLFGKCRIIVL